MKIRFAIFLLLCAAVAPAQPAKIEPSAEALVRRAFDVQAGEAWEKARYFAFTFNLDRDGKPAASFPQRWDRTTGDYRVSGVDPQGKKFEVVMNVNSKSGKAWVGGAAVTGDKLAEMLALAFRRFQNDTHWLLMPLTMRNPNVERAYETLREDACNHSWDLVRLRYDQSSGLNPADIYWAWINRDTGMVDYWDMKLAIKPDDPKVTVTFRDFRRVGGLLISTRRDIPAKKQTVRLEDLQVLPDVPKGAFE